VHLGKITHVPGRTGYAVVSCHVERPLEEEVWARYLELIERRPGGFAIASLMRPPMDGEDGSAFVERARMAASLGPYGHHIHWTSPTHARPTASDPAAAVLREGAWLREQGLEPRFFCGGGWYTDPDVMGALADLGYTDCTATAWRPSYLPPGSRRAGLAQPAHVVLDDGRRVLELPTTHSLGTLARSLAGPLPQIVHLHFHDYELLEAPRRAALLSTLAVLGRRRRPVRLDALGADDEVAWPAVYVG
jgi:hypothetical protein